MKFVTAFTVAAIALSACTNSNSAPTPTASPAIADCSAFAKLPVGSGELPAVEVECLQGGEVINLSQLKGPLVMPVWASWCVPCSEEMPVMQVFTDLYGDYVDVLGIALLDESTQAIAGSVNWGVTLPSLEDPDGLLRPELGITAPPTTLFIDETGAIVHREFGAVSNLGELKVLVETHLGVKL